MDKKILMLLMCCTLAGIWVFGALPVSAQTSPVPQASFPPIKNVIRQEPFPGSDFGPWNDALADRIGYRLSQAMEEWGAPASAWASRGNEAFQDAVVFYYPDHTYAYFWNDRIWQIRLDRLYRGKAFGVTMGMTRKDVLKVLGKPQEETPGMLRYALPDRGWPLEILLFFAKDKLDDLYLRRGDF